MFRYQREIEEWLGVSLRPNARGEVQVRCICPGHDDNSPSLSINCESGLWHCFGCGKKGNIYHLAEMLGKTPDTRQRRERMEPELNKMETTEDANHQSKISDEQRALILKETSEFYHQQLLNAKRGHPGEGYLLSKRIARRLIQEYRIGLAGSDGLKEYLIGKRFGLDECIECGVLKLQGNEVIQTFRNSIIFPVMTQGSVVYIVARRLGENEKPKYLNLKGTIKWLYNQDIRAHSKSVILAEGIPDTLTLIQHGYPAVGTLGAGLFKDEFKGLFAGVSNKYIGFDNDAPGMEGMRNVNGIFDGGIKVIALPQGIKDISDYFRDHETKDFDRLIKSAKWFTNYELDRQQEKAIHLIDIESPENIGKRVSAIMRIAGVGATCFVPVRFRVFYQVDGALQRSRAFTIPQNSPIIIGMCRSTEENHIKALAKFASQGLVPKAEIRRIEIDEYTNVTQLIALPKIKELKTGASGELITEEGKEYRQKVVYFQGMQSSTSKGYKANGYVLADPKTAEARLLVSDYEEIKEKFDEFRLTPNAIKRFELFRRKPDESIDDYLDKLAESAAYHFIRIVGEARKDAIIANLLCFHSALYFEMEQEIIPGWLQIVCIGDTTTGKSKIAGQIARFVEVGVIVTGETCSRTGFLYCIDTKTLTSSTLTWGLLPQQDRSILIIDGANYISPEDWGTAREARRSGKLQVERVVKGEHPCRTRLILLGNPPKPLNQYIYPVEAVKDIFQDPDIARSDLLLSFMNSDVPKEEINLPQDERPVPEMTVDRATLQDSVHWAWQRSLKDIIIGDDVVRAINETANRLLEIFGAASDIPLVSNDVKYKVARLSVALACLLHSTDEGHGKVIVTVEIVSAVERYIVRVYTAPNCRLDQYALDRKSSANIASDEVAAIQRALDDEAKKDRSNILTDMITIFRTNNIIRLNEISARLDKSDSTIKAKLVLFKRFGLIRSGKSGYAKTEKFIQFLNQSEHEKKAIPALPPQQNMTPIQKVRRLYREAGSAIE